MGVHCGFRHMHDVPTRSVLVDNSGLTPSAFVSTELRGQVHLQSGGPQAHSAAAEDHRDDGGLSDVGHHGEAARL